MNEVLDRDDFAAEIITDAAKLAARAFHNKVTISDYFLCMLHCK